MNLWIRLTLLASALSVLAAGAAAADQRIFDMFHLGDTGPAVAWLEVGGDPEIRDKKGMTLLHWAGWKGEIDVAEIVRTRGVDVDIATPGGITPVMHASHGGPPEMVAFLLEEGADVTLVTENGFSALHMWGLNGDPDTLALLLDAGSDPVLPVDNPGKPINGALPLDIARANTPWALNTEAGRRLQRLTYEGTGCEGVIVRTRDTKLSLLAERTLGKASRWKEIATLNGLGADKSYRLGDCLKLPVR